MKNVSIKGTINPLNSIIQKRGERERGCGRDEGRNEGKRRARERERVRVRECV
jgi:hypothetical protein